jgi:hypothetical protein
VRRESGSQAPVNVLFHSITAEGDTFDRGSRSQCTHQVVSATIGQSNIADNQVKFLALTERYRPLVAGRGDDFVATKPEEPAHKFQGVMMIVH